MMVTAMDGQSEVKGSVNRKTTHCKALLLLVLLALGQLCWAWLNNWLQLLAVQQILSPELAVVLSRLGLVGYLLLLGLWQLRDGTREHYLRAGSLSAPIRMPFIWRGWQDRVGRVATGFSVGCLAAAAVLAVRNNLPGRLVGLGVLFAVLNAVLEELLWRGLVLGRIADLYGEKAGLLLMSLAFGIYHYPLGFSLPVCLFFSLGGVYFGGVTLRSKGLLAATGMHICMNLLFVAVGIVF